MNRNFTIYKNFTNKINFSKYSIITILVNLMWKTLLDLQYYSYCILYD